MLCPVFFLLVFALSVLSIRTGFGPGLLLMPALIVWLGVERAVPLITGAHLVMVLPHLMCNARHCRWKDAVRFLLGAVPFGVGGAFVFVALPAAWATRCVGTAMLLCALTRRIGRAYPTRLSERAVAWGALAGAVSGSSGTAGMLEAPCPDASEWPQRVHATTLAAAVVPLHAAKMVIYQRFVELDWQFWQATALVTLAMFLGACWVERVAARRIAPGTQRAVECCLTLAAAYMLVYGAIP